MLKLKEDARTAAFRAIVAKIRNDAVLKTVVTKWKAIPFAPIELTISDLPYVIIGLTGGTTSVGSPESLADELQVSIRYAVDASGMNEEHAWADIINLYGTIVRAIDPFGPVAWLKEAIQKVDTTAVVHGNITITKPGYTSVPVANVNAIQGETVISVPLKIRACGG